MPRFSAVILISCWFHSPWALAFSPITCSLPAGTTIDVGEQQVRRLSILSNKRMQLEGYRFQESLRGRRFPVWSTSRYSIEFAEQLAGTYLIEALQSEVSHRVASFILAVAAQAGKGIAGELGVYLPSQDPQEDLPAQSFPVVCDIGKRLPLSVR